MEAAPHATASRDGPCERAAWLVVASGLALAVALALRLASVALNQTLSSDVLYPHLFAQELLTGGYPPGGWSFGGATFFFPDYVIYLPLLAVLGQDGTSFAAYAAVWFLALTALVAAVARCWMRCEPTTAWLAGILTANTTLALQFFPQHIPVLWWLPLPGYHGGTLLNGLALIALVGRMLTGTPAGRTVWLATGAILWLGLAANTLLLIQFAGPLLVAAWWIERRTGKPAGLAPRLALLGLLAGIGVLLLRHGLTLANWGYYFPLRPLHKFTPGALWRATIRFYRDVALDLAPHAWGWLAGLMAWLGLWVLELRRRSQTALRSRALALHLMVALSICLMADALIASGWWINWNNGRYLLNVMLLPFVMLSIAGAHALGSWLHAGGRKVWLAAVTSTGVAIAILATTDHAGWKFQPTAAARDYAELVQRHHLHRGLAGYWQANLLNTLVDSPGAHRLVALLGEGKPYFWCNNAFWYFGRPTPDDVLPWPTYDFVLTAELDRSALLARFGEPAQIVRQGKWEIFIYDTAGQDRIRAALMPEVVAKLGPARLGGLRPKP